MTEANAQKLLTVYMALRNSGRIQPFEPEDLTPVSIVCNMNILYGDRELLPRGFQNEGLDHYLAKYSTEEIAGHVNLYVLEWRDAEND